MEIPKTTIQTTETEFAASMMTRGGKLLSWTQDETGRVAWTVENVDPQWVDDYRMGKDQFLMLLRNRTMLVSIAKSLKKPQ